MKTSVTYLVRLVAILAAVCGLAVNSGAQNGAPQDYSRVSAVPRAELDAWIKEQAAASGADWNNGRYTFYIGFATGHYGTDPVSAIAMRRAAFSLMNATLAAGDRLVPEAFEMNLAQPGEPITLTSDPATRARFVDEVPYTSIPESHGGHDIERALYETLQHIPASETASSVVLLLNKDNASQAPTGANASLFGSDNPQLKQAIVKGGFRPTPVRKQFQMQSATGPVVVAVTALFPAHMASLPGSFGARYPTFPLSTWQPLADAPASANEVPNPVSASPSTAEPHAPNPTPADQTTAHKGLPGWLIPLVLLILVAAAAIAIFGKRAGVQAARPVGAAAAAAKARPVHTSKPALPGTVKISVAANEFVFPELRADSAWALFTTPAGETRLIDLTPPAEGGEAAAVPGDAQVSARLSLTPEGALLAMAEIGSQFVELQGTDLARSDSQKLTIAPGKRILCRVLTASTGAKVRFEAVYELQKGGR